MNMKLNYLITPTANIADIGKVGSSSLSYAILKTFHPEKEIVWEGADPANTPNHLGRNRIPRTETPELTVLVPVRDAVERFRSACSQSRIEDVDALLTKLETGGVLRNDNKAIESFHFRPQSDYLYPDSTVKLYRFPEDFDALGTEGGLPVPLPVINDGDSQNPPKPNLTAEQITRLEAIYADDIALRDSIATAGQELIVPPAPPAPTEPLDLEAVKASLRPERNRLLTSSDWTQLNDTPLPEDHIAAWAAYRQDLRDLTDEIDENGEVDFPEKP